jgi:RNA polymerase sigma-70 factor, ECF subfamily
LVLTRRDRNALAPHWASRMTTSLNTLQFQASHGRIFRSRSRERELPAADLGECVRPEKSPAEVQQTLGRLFHAHHALIWRTLRRLGASKEAAADFTQQAYVIASERFSQIRPGCERAFLFSTAIGLANTSRRREWRCQLEADMASHEHTLRQEEDATRHHYARQLVDGVLMKMDVALVSVFVLFEFEGMSGPEIAETLGSPLGTVASRLRRARQIFKDEVERLEQVVESKQP